MADCIFDRGQSTEVTSYDYDGYLVGERITLDRPGNLYFDEISITYGFLGDFNRPNVFGRLHRLGQSNYHEFGVSKTDRRANPDFGQLCV